MRSTLCHKHAHTSACRFSLLQPNAGLPTTVFSVFTALAIKHNTINLGQVGCLSRHFESAAQPVHPERCSQWPACVHAHVHDLACLLAVQGFPDEEGPETMKQLVGEYTLSTHNQCALPCLARAAEPLWMSPEVQ